MKNLILLLLETIMFSCTNNSVPVVTQSKTDTIVISHKDTIVISKINTVSKVDSIFLSRKDTVVISKKDTTLLVKIDSVIKNIYHKDSIFIFKTTSKIDTIFIKQVQEKPVVIPTLPIDTASLKWVFKDDYSTWSQGGINEDTLIKKYNTTCFGWINGNGGSTYIMNESGVNFVRSDYPSGGRGSSEGVSGLGGGYRFGIPLGNGYRKIWMIQKVRLKGGFDLYNNTYNSGGGKLFSGLAGGEICDAGSCAHDTIKGFFNHSVWAQTASGNNFIFSSYENYLEMYNEPNAYEWGYCSSGGTCSPDSRCYGIQYNWPNTPIIGSWFWIITRLELNDVGQSNGFEEVFISTDGITAHFVNGHYNLKFRNWTNGAPGDNGLRIDKNTPCFWYGGANDGYNCDASSSLDITKIGNYILGTNSPDYVAGHSASNRIIQVHDVVGTMIPTNNWYSDQVFTASSGTIQSHDMTRTLMTPSEKTGTYVTKTISIAGASSITINFSRWGINHDGSGSYASYFDVYNSSGTRVYNWTIVHNGRQVIPTTNTNYTIPGNKITIKFYPGLGINTGWKLNYISN